MHRCSKNEIIFLHGWKCLNIFHLLKDQILLSFVYFYSSLSESQKSRGKKRKRNESDEEEEEEYEKQARTFSEDKEKDMKMMLPIISKGKVIKRMGVREEFEGKIR